MKMKSSDGLKLVTSVVVCEFAGVIGGIFSTSAIPTWYAGLQKPSFTPPNWLFAPAWITLYLLMGIAAFVVWRKGLADSRVSVALAIFLAQLVLNALWSVVFFGLKSPLFGVVVIATLWVAILVTVLAFFKISKVAGALLLPYFAWVTFAAALNVSIWILNP